ncbi:DNA repair protein RecN [Verminephrobacter aporrectodeae subsp. tuberculatae]|uniref:DNA repair protein RecN n=2 Tax=Verminephrobacter aporrectodeae TaxID=1110389 RepID=UPI002243DD8C|nr:DNA repair protein RecN [Verminephrobacter aporrectodeae]MCW8205758.1 DNA repair protein RecN [Verminephrobacter aporrectodeae subsp. tuberculatae]
MALRRITLRDFVIVQALEPVELESGFTVLTGETGAGKSILIDALQLALGARSDAGVVREGALRTDICAEFDCPAHVRPWLEEAGFDADDLLLLRRTVDTQGKSRAWVNGTPATATQLRALGDLLLDIHGQHAWQSLTRPESVRGLLDAFAGIGAAETTALWTQWRCDQKALQQARQAQTSLQQERERLQWQIGELDKLAPAQGEWDELEAQHKRLSHAQALLDGAGGALQTLQEDEAGALAGLARAQALLQAQEHIEPEFASLANILSSSLAQASDVVHSLQSYLGHAQVDPERLAQLDARLALWMALARRYKRAPGELPALLEDWKAQLHELDAATDLEQLAAAQATSAAAYQAAAQALSAARARAAPRLSQAITQAMQDLGMAGGKFEVSVTKAQEAASHGIDDVVFLVAGHPGMTPKPIGKVASGGELSRIALAISVTTSALGMAPTLIFDEVDSGVGGAVAETVGRLMQRLGSARQVLAVTHLPQVAACAHHHLQVAKHKSPDGTSSTVQVVQGEQRVAEIARMLGGERATETTLAHARELLAGALAGEREWHPKSS